MQNHTDFDRRETARLKYKPDKIRFLLVAEAPPLDPTRFFYFEDMTVGDGFYLEVMNALYSDDRFDPKYLRENKAAFLNCLRRDGFYLLDACDQPMEITKRSYKKKRLREAIPDLKLRISDLICAETKIILILATVYRICFSELKSAGFCVINRRSIPFPGSGHQIEFREEFKPLLQIYGWNGGNCAPDEIRQ